MTRMPDTAPDSQERSTTAPSMTSRGLNCIARLAALLSVLAIGQAHAFDPAGATPGLYYSGTNVGEQIWTPLVLVRDGALVDPAIEVRDHGLSALEGLGKTRLLKATSFYLYGGCGTGTRLAEVAPLFGGVPTIYVAGFDEHDCAVYQSAIAEKWTQPTAADIDDSMPRLQLSPPYADLPSGPIWGVPGSLIKANRQVAREPLSEAAGRHGVVNGIVRSTWFVPLPIIHPDASALSIETGRKLPSSRHGKLSEIAHRKEIEVDARLVTETGKRLEPLMRERFLAKLEALGKPFGGAVRSAFAMQAVIGVDIDSSGYDDLVGVARLQVEMRDGTSRWIDSAWSVRSAAKGGELEIIRSTAVDVLRDDSPYRSTKNPSPKSPTLVIAGIFDLDNDGNLELVIAQDEPIGKAVVHEAPTLETTVPVARQDAVIYSWSAKAAGHWAEIFHGVPHEARTLPIPFKNISKITYGQ